jgi:hypothetical protein
MVQPLMYSNYQQQQQHKGPTNKKGHTGCMHHVMTGFCQVGALPTLINSQQPEDGKPIHSLPIGCRGKN